MQELLKLRMHELHKLLHEKEITSEQLVGAYLNEISGRNDFINAYTNIFHDRAIQAAQEADQRLQSGNAGPLCGIPYAVKDIIDIAGEKTTLGSISSAVYKANADAAVVQRLRAAGMVPLGKVHTVEFAYGGWGTNQHLGAPRNPLSTTEHYITGGSSSGSAAAVAAQLAPAALGTDTGGSVRIPSSFCGLTGLRPTQGLIPTVGIKSLSPSLDTVGPIANGVQDTALMFSAMAGRFAMTTDSHDAAFAKGLKVAVLADAERTLVHQDVITNYDKSIKILERAGADIQQLSLPYALPELATITASMISIEGYPAIKGVIDNPNDPVDIEVRERFLDSKRFTDEDYNNILQSKYQIQQRFEHALRGFDLFITPTTVNTAIPLNDVSTANWSPAMFTRFVSLTGWPALAIPNGCGTSTMPTSLQLIGRPFTEHLLFKVASLLEE